MPWWGLAEMGISIWLPVSGVQGDNTRQRRRHFDQLVLIATAPAAAIQVERQRTSWHLSSPRLKVLFPCLTTNAAPPCTSRKGIEVHCPLLPLDPGSRWLIWAPCSTFLRDLSDTGPCFSYSSCLFLEWCRGGWLIALQPPATRILLRHLAVSLWSHWTKGKTIAL